MHIRDSLESIFSFADKLEDQTKNPEEFKTVNMYNTGKYLFKDISSSDKNRFEELVVKIKKIKKKLSYHKLYFVINAETSADGQRLSKNALSHKYKRALVQFKSKYNSDGPNNVISSDKGNLRLAFLRMFYFLEELYKEFPEFNYEKTEVNNLGSSNSISAIKNSKLRYSKYTIRIYTEETYKQVVHAKN